MSDEGDRASAPPRVLRALVEELRASEVPPIAWDDMEARLLAKIDASGVVPPAVEAAVGAVGPVAEERAEILVPWDDEPDAPEEAWAGPDVGSLPAGRTSADEASLPGSSSREVPRVPRAPAVGSPSVAARPLTRGVPVPTRGPARAWGVAGLAVAAAAAWMLWPRLAPTPVVAEPVDLAAVAVEPRLGDAFDLAGLRAGDVVEASEGPVTFARAGFMRWTLSAGGRVRVVSGVGHEEPRHVVALEQGALDVEVTPPGVETELGAQSGERFVVEVAGARVAVHGTAFRVVRSSRVVVLDVVRGVVAVGPLAGGEGSGQLIEAPARASFGLDGSALQPLPALAAAGVGKAPAPERAAGREVVARSGDDERYAGMVEELSGPSSKVARPAAPAPAPKAPEAAAAGTPGGEAVDARTEQPWTADRVRSEVTACIARSGDKGGDSARVTIASSVVVDVDAAGSTRAVRFDPPIRPDLQACAQPVLRARFPAGTGRLLVPLEVRLGPSK